MLVTLTRVEMTQAGTTLPSPTRVRICDDDTRRKLCCASTLVSFLTLFRTDGVRTSHHMCMYLHAGDSQQTPTV